MFEDILQKPSQVINAITPNRRDRLNSFKGRLRDFEQGKTDLSDYRSTGTLDTRYDTPEVTTQTPESTEATPNRPNQDVYQPETSQTTTVPTNKTSDGGILDMAAKLTFKAATSPWATIKDMFGSLAAEKNTIDNATIRGDIYRNINPKLEAITDIEKYKSFEKSLNDLDNAFESNTLPSDINYYQERNNLYNNYLLSKEKAKDALVYLKTEKGGADGKYRSTQDYSDPEYKRNVVAYSTDSPEEWAVGFSDVKMNNRTVGTARAEYNFTKNVNDQSFLDDIYKERDELLNKKNSNLKDIQTNNDDIQYWKSKVSSDYLNKRGNTNNWAEYAFYEVPALAGSSFANFTEQALASATGMASGAFSGTGVGPMGTAVGAGLGLASAYYTMEGRKKESLAELSEGYEDRLRNFYNAQGLNESTVTPEIYSQLTGVDPSQLSSRPKNSEELFQSLMMREVPFADQNLDEQVSNIERQSLSGANVLYDLNNTLGVMDAAQIFINAFPVGRALKNNVKLPTPTSIAVRKAESTLDNIAESSMGHALNKLKNGYTQTIRKANTIWDKSPEILKSGINLAKKTAMNAVAEGAEEGAQFEFQEQFKSGKYDGMSGVSLPDLAKLSLQSNYKVYGTILGFDADPVLKDNDEFWENVKGGMVLGLGMGGGYGAVETIADLASKYRSKFKQDLVESNKKSAESFVNTDFLNEIRRQAALDQVTQQDNMNKSKMYVDQITKNRSQYILDSFDSMKANLPEGVTEEIIDQEIQHFNDVNELVNNKSIDAIRKNANIDRGSIEHGILIGLVDRYRNQITEATDAVRESNEEVQQIGGQQNIMDIIPTINSIAELYGFDSSVITNDNRSAISNNIVNFVGDHNRDRMRLNILKDLKELANSSQSEFSKLNTQYQTQFGTSLNSAIGESDNNISKSTMLNTIDRQIAGLEKAITDRRDTFNSFAKNNLNVDETIADSLDPTDIMNDDSLFEALREPYLKQILNELRVNELNANYSREVKDNFKASIDKHIASTQRFANTEKNNTNELSNERNKEAFESVEKGVDLVSTTPVPEDNLRTIPTEPILNTPVPVTEQVSQEATQADIDYNSISGSSDGYFKMFAGQETDTNIVPNETITETKVPATESNKIANPTPTSNVIAEPIKNTREQSLVDSVLESNVIDQTEPVYDDPTDSFTYPDVPLDVPVFEQDTISEEALVESTLTNEVDEDAMYDQMDGSTIYGEEVASAYEQMFKAQSNIEAIDSVQADPTIEEKIDARLDKYLKMGMTQEQAQRMIELADQNRADIRSSMGTMGAFADPVTITRILLRTSEMLGIYIATGIKNLNVIISNTVSELRGSAPDSIISNVTYMGIRNMLESGEMIGQNITDYVEGYATTEEALAASKTILDSIFNSNKGPAEEINTSGEITPVDIQPSSTKIAELRARLTQGLRLITFADSNRFEPKLFGNNQTEFNNFIKEAGINGSYEDLNNKLKKDSNGLINNSSIEIISFGLQSSSRAIRKNDIGSYANQYIVYIITDKRDGKKYANTYPLEKTYLDSISDNIRVGQFDSFMDMSNADGLSQEQIREEARQSYLEFAKSLRDLYEEASILNGHEPNDWRAYLKGSNKVSPVSKGVKYITNNLKQNSPGIREFKEVKGLPTSNFSKIKPGAEFTETTMPLFIMKGDPANPNLPINIINYNGLSIPSGSRNILVESGRVYSGAGNSPTIMMSSKKIGDFSGLGELIYDLVTRQQDSNAFVARNLKGEPLHFTPSQLIDLIVGRKKEYFKSDADNGVWGFHRYDDNGVSKFRIGFNSYDSNTLMNKQQVLEVIKSIDFNGRSEKKLFGLNPGQPDNNVTLRNSELATYVGDNNINITDNLKFTKDQLNDGTTWLGWLINNGVYTVNIADNPLTKSIETSGSFNIVTNEGDTSPMIKPETVKEKKKKPVIKPDTDFVDDFFGGALRPITREYVPGNMRVEKEKLRSILGDSFVDSSVNIVDDVIKVASKGIKAFGITRNDSITLFSRAEEGTGYHEAYHRVSLLLMDKADRENIYKTFKKNNPKFKDATNQVVEEELAEGFRHYVISDESLNYQKEISSWYKRLIDFARRLFNVGDSRIKSLYNNIYAGKFANVIPSLDNVNEFNKEYDNIVPFKIADHEFDAIPTYSTLTTITRTLLGALLLSNNIRSFEDVQGNQIDFDTLFEKLKSRTNNKEYEEYYGPYVNDIVKNKDYFIEELKRKLATLNINVTETKDYEANQKENIEDPRGYDREAFEVNMRDYAPLVIKLFLGTVPKKKITKEGLEVIFDDYLQLPLLYDYAESYKRAAQQLSSYKSFKDMYKRIKELSVRDPFFAGLSEKLDRYYKRLADESEIENFNTKFFQTLSMFSYNYVKSNIYADNDILIQDANLDQHINKKTADWNSTFVESSKLFEKNRDGQFAPDKESIKKISDSYVELYQEVIEATNKEGLATDVYNNLRDRLYALFNKVGIVFPEANGEFIDQWLVDKYGEILPNPEQAVSIENLNRLMSNQAKFDNQPVVTGNIYNFFVNDINNINNEGLPREKRGNFEPKPIPSLEIFKSRSFIKEAASRYGKAYPGTETDMTVTSGGGKRYKYSLNSFITDQISGLDSNTDGVLNMKLQVPYYKNSLVLKALLDENGNRNKKKIRLETYTGLNFVGVNDKGRDFTEISPLEDYVMKLSALYYDRNNVNGTANGNGRLVLPILADRKTTHFITVDGMFLPHGTNLLEYRTSERNGSVTPVFSESVVKIFHGYFKDELNAIRQTANLYKSIEDASTEVEKKELRKKLISNYHKGKMNGFKMRYFTGLSLDGVNYEDLNSVIKGDKYNPDNVLAALDYIENKYKFDDSGNINYQDRAFSIAINNMLNDLIVEELNTAIELGAVHSKEDVRISGIPNFSSLSGIDPTTFEFTLPKTIYSKFKETFSTYDKLSDGLASYMMIADYTVNNIISMQEFEKMFTGDPAYHKDNDAYIKRKAIPASTGNSPRRDFAKGFWGTEDFENYTTAEMSDSEVISDYHADLYKNFQERFYEESDQIIPLDTENRDEARKEYAKEATERALGVYTYDEKGNPQINQGDGGVYISPAMFKKLMIMDQGWNQQMEDAYNILQSDEEWWTSPSKTNTVSSLIMQPLKYVSYNTVYDAMPDGTTLEKIVADKMALFTVWKRTATGDMSSLYNRMNDPNRPIDMVKFNSAVKAGNAEMFDLYENKEHTKLNDLNGITTYSQKFKYIRKQLITDPHNTDDSSFGTQVIKAALSNIIKDRVYDDINIDGRNDFTGKELISEIMNHIGALSDRGAVELMNEFGNVNNGEFTIDEKKVSKMLMREAESAGMTSNVINALKINPLTDRLTTRLSAVSDHSWLQSRLISLMNDKTINVHSAGGAMIQQSSFGLVYNGDIESLSDHAKKNLINGGKKLRFLNTDGSMDAVVSINLFKGILKDAGKWDDVSHQERVIWLKEAGIIGSEASPAVMGYRIPTQGQSSISSLRIVDLLPENVGDTIILPDEFTALTGSDFDIDKLYVARYYYNKDGSKVKFNHDTELTDSQNKYTANSSKANINRMLDIYMGLLNSKYHIHETRMPLDNPVTYLKNTALRDINQADELKGSGKKILPFEYLTPHYQLQKKNEYFTGKSGLGPFALNNVHHVLSQIVDLSFKSDAVLDRFGISDLSRINGEDNYKILDWLNAMISAHVDVAKDSYVIRLGVNSYTYNMTNFLIRSGKGSATFYFLAQDIIKDISLAAQKAKGKYNQPKGMKPSQIERKNIQEVKVRYEQMLADSTNGLLGTGRDIPEIKQISYEDLFKYKDNKPKALRKALLRVYKSKIDIANDVQNAIIEYQKEHEFANQDELTRVANEAEYKAYLNNTRYATEQLGIFEAFTELKSYSEQMSELVTVSQVDTKKYGNNFTDMRLFMNRISKVKTEQAFNNLNDLFNATFLGKKIDNSLKLMSNMFKNMLIVTTDKFAVEHNQLLDLVGSIYTKDTILANNLASAIEGQFKSEFFNEYTESNGIDIYKLFYGPDSVPNRVNNIKADIAEGKFGEDMRKSPNALLDRLTGLTQGFETEGHGIRTRIVFDNGSMLKDDLVLNWQDLLNSEYPDIKKLGEDLVIFAFYASQDKPGKNTFFDLVPYEYRDQIGYNDFISKKEVDYVNGVTNFDADDIFQNNWHNDNIVPYFRESKNIRTYSKSEGQLAYQGFKYSYSEIAPHTIVDESPNNINRTNRFGQTLYRPYFKYSVGREPYLYRLAGTYMRKTKDGFKEAAVYQLIPKKGYSSPNSRIFLYNNLTENNKLESTKRAKAFQHPGFFMYADSNLGTAGQIIGQSMNYIYDIVPDKTIYDTDRVYTNNIAYQDNTIIINDKGNFSFNLVPIETYNSEMASTDLDSVYAFVEDLDYNKMTFSQFKKSVDSEIVKIKRGILSDKLLKYVSSRPIGANISNNNYKAYINNRLLEVGINNFGSKPMNINGNITDINVAARKQLQLDEHNFDPFVVKTNESYENYVKRVRAISPNLKPTVIKRFFNEKGGVVEQDNITEQPAQQIPSDQVINDKPIKTVYESPQFKAPGWDDRTVRFFTDRNGNFIEGHLLNQGVWDNNPAYQAFLKQEFLRLNKYGAVFSIYNLDTSNVFNLYTDILKNKYPQEAGSLATFSEYWTKLSEQAKKLIINQILNCL